MKKITYTERLTTEKSVRTFCDKCNQEIIPQKYDGFNCDMELKIGEFVPFDGGWFNGERFSIGLCEPCAEDLFKNVLPKLGYNVNVSDE